MKRYLKPCALPALQRLEQLRDQRDAAAADGRMRRYAELNAEYEEQIGIACGQPGWPIQRPGAPR